MRIAVDLDNTIVDEFGRSVRPGMREFLIRMRGRGHTLILFTQSTKARAWIILRDHGLHDVFHAFLFREDWDPENRNPPKDLRIAKADAIIDDDPQNVAAARAIGKRGILVKPYRGSRMPADDIRRIEQSLEESWLKRLLFRSPD
jgi:FMN phosphatase YigB (HAD superfamily)